MTWNFRASSDPWFEVWRANQRVNTYASLQGKHAWIVRCKMEKRGNASNYATMHSNGWTCVFPAFYGRMNIARHLFCLYQQQSISRKSCTSNMLKLNCAMMQQLIGSTNWELHSAHFSSICKLGWGPNMPIPFWMQDQEQSVHFVFPPVLEPQVVSNALLTRVESVQLLVFGVLHVDHVSLSTRTPRVPGDHLQQQAIMPWFQNPVNLLTCLKLPLNVHRQVQHQGSAELVGPRSRTKWRWNFIQPQIAAVDWIILSSDKQLHAAKIESLRNHLHPEKCVTHRLSQLLTSAVGQCWDPHHHWISQSLPDRLEVELVWCICPHQASFLHA